ncbi:MAG: hypothetical protein IJZ46_01740 [Bacilli bacterium]|nr:hypothetical protein [Bacilli bacterium]
MILRRPYAFLIKHFRFIHLLLFGLLVYVTVKANDMLSFFKEYIDVNGNIEIISSNYISYMIFVSFFLIIAFSLIIYYLMRYKDKPRFLYIFIIIICILSLGLFIFLYINIRELEISSMSGRELRLLRDISRFNYWLLFLVCIPILIRGLGFDIKKFNFRKDIADLKLEDKDSEEVEVNASIDSDSAKRSLRKFLREFKYYYIENKFIINIILIIVVIILILIFPFNKYVINRDLNEGEILSSSYFDISVDDSYISYRNRISKNNFYLILKFNIRGKVDKYGLDLDEFVLVGDNNKYIPSLKYYYYFSDVGNGYRNNILNTDDYDEYILIYNVDINDKNSDFILNYIGNDKNIKLSPEVMD